MDFIVLRFVRRIASAWNVLIQVQNYRTLKISNIWQMVLASLKHNPFSELVRWKGIFLQASGETPIEIASGLAEAIFTCQTGECTDALGKNLEAWSGVSWWKKCSQKQFWRTIFKLSTHLLRASRLDRLDSYRYTHVLYPLRKSWILHTKIFWVCLWLRNTSNTSLTTWFISVFTIYRVLLLCTLWCRLIFELLSVSACRAYVKCLKLKTSFIHL